MTESWPPLSRQKPQQGPRLDVFRRELEAEHLPPAPPGSLGNATAMWAPCAHGSRGDGQRLLGQGGPLIPNGAVMFYDLSFSSNQEKLKRTKKPQYRAICSERQGQGHRLDQGVTARALTPDSLLHP